MTIQNLGVALVLRIRLGMDDTIKEIDMTMPNQQSVEGLDRGPYPALTPPIVKDDGFGECVSSNAEKDVNSMFSFGSTHVQETLNGMGEEDCSGNG